MCRLVWRCRSGFRAVKGFLFGKLRLIPVFKGIVFAIEIGVFYFLSMVGGKGKLLRFWGRDSFFRLGR